MDFENLVFEMAYFWRVPPLYILKLTLTEINQHQRHAERIAKLINAEG